MYKEADTFYLANITTRGIRDFLLGAFIIVLYLSGALEIFTNSVQEARLNYFTLSTFNLYFYFCYSNSISFRRSSVFPGFQILIYCHLPWTVFN
jgi:hypothetical protein